MKSFASEVYQAVKVGKLSQPFNAAMAKKDLKCLRNGVIGKLAYRSLSVRKLPKTRLSGAIPILLLHP
jgi:hypothetical protein